MTYEIMWIKQFFLWIYWNSTCDIYSYSISHIYWYTIRSIYDFIGHIYWSINNIFYLLFLPAHVLRFFFARAIVFTLALTFIIIPFLICFTYCTIGVHLESHKICLTNYFASFALLIILNALTFKSFLSLGTHIFVDKSSTALQFPLNWS